MQKLLILVVAVGLLFSAVLAEDDGDVRVLTDKNFQETLNDNEFVFVEFYAPWCGHCKHLAPDWSKLATHFKETDAKVVIGKVDATVETKAANDHGVRGYPTLIFFKNGSPIKYEQDRSLQAMINFVAKKSGPSSIELDDKAKLEAFTEKGGVVAFIVGDAESIEYKNWIRAATSGQLEDFALGHVFNPAVRGEYKNTVVIFKSNEDPIVFDEDAMTKTKIISFIQAEGYPLFEEISQNVWSRHQNANKPLLAVFAEASETKLVSELAKKFKGKIGVTHAVLPSNKALAERWGASGKVFPTAIFADWKGMTSPQMVVFNEEGPALSAASGIAFVEAAQEGTYEGYIKSEPEPESQAEGAATVLVAKTFEKLVNDPTKDVFVEFYAPWCGHCKKLAPIWDELATTFKDADHIRIAKIDATANTVPKNVNVRGYPTLIMFPANNKKTGVTFNGERDLAALTKFVKEQSTQQIKEDL